MLTRGICVNHRCSRFEYPVSAVEGDSCSDCGQLLCHESGLTWGDARTDVKHAGVEMIPNVMAKLAEEWDRTSTTYTHRAQLIADYLHLYAAGDCPGCGHGNFGWGIQWGAGRCVNYECGWPGTLYHVIYDNGDDPDLICGATCNGHRVCTARRGDHVEEKRRLYIVDGPRKGESLVETRLMCPEPVKPPGLLDPFTSEYRPTEVASFNGVLWAHPDYVTRKIDEEGGEE